MVQAGVGALAPVTTACRPTGAPSGVAFAASVVAVRDGASGGGGAPASAPPPPQAASTKAAASAASGAPWRVVILDIHSLLWNATFAQRGFSVQFSISRRTAGSVAHRW